MQTDRFRPVIALHKEIELRFVFDYHPGEFHDTLHMIADGKVVLAEWGVPRSLVGDAEMLARN